jgi:vancomycin resistance protein YoaR
VVTDTSTPTPLAKEKKGGRVVVLLLLGLVILFGGAYVAAYYAAGDKVPQGTTVAGVDIGGRSEAAAVAALENGLADRAAAPLAAQVNSEATTVSPEKAGLAVDYAESVRAAGGERSWSPGHLWDYFTGGDDLPAVVSDLDQKHGVAAANGAVTFTEGQVEVKEPVTGSSIDRDSAREALLAAYLHEDGQAQLSTVPEEPSITADEVRAAVNDFANPAVSGPVRLDFGKSAVTLTPAAFTKALSLDGSTGELVPTVDEKVLGRLIDGLISEDGAPVDATVALVDGRPKVIPAKPGVSYSDADAATTLLKVVTAPTGEREGAVKSTVAEPEFTTAEARKLRIVERVSTFTTYYPYAEYRNINIGRAAQLVNGTLLKPGETFSLNETVGERTRENGFTEGFIISDGIFKEDLGGGVSQMATTTFNAMFFAGLKDVEHKPHSFYIDRYPVGREATVAWGAVDLRFQNDTKYGVLVQAAVTPSTPSTSGIVTVSMWSTKVWDITTTTGDRYNLTEPATRTLDTEDCYPNEGYGGFDIDIMRYFRKAGSSVLDHSEKMHTSYTPSDTVICKRPPTP